MTIIPGLNMITSLPIRTIFSGLAFLVGVLVFPGSVGAGEATRVLLLHSFGRDFEPYRTVSAEFRSELTRQAGGMIDLVDVDLQGARFQGAAGKDAFLGYLVALFTERRVDLVVSIGGPAVRFTQDFRDRLLPGVPHLGVADERHFAGAAPTGKDAAVAVRIDPARVLGEMLHLFPDRTNILLVLGESEVERFWRAELREAFAPFASRVHVDWAEGLAFDRILARASGLPAGWAIFYGQMAVDAAGVAHAEDRALAELREMATAPIFGLHDYQLGSGIVGGTLTPIRELSLQAAVAAVRVLRGGSPVGVRPSTVAPRGPAFDGRELRRWRVGVNRLPTGAAVLFSEPTFWERYWGRILVVAGVCLAQVCLISLLYANLVRRRRAEQQARQFGARLIVAQEAERSRLARELHDDITQRLAVLAIDAGKAERAPVGSEVAGALREMRDGLVRLSEDVHLLSHRLHPALLEDLGLAEALRAECERVTRQSSIPITLACDAIPAGLSADASLCLFRVVQEGLRNMVRHAHASEAWVGLRCAQGEVELSIADDGAGFDPAGRRRGVSLGLTSMEERVRLLDGSFRVHTAPGEGTRIVVRLPASSSHDPVRECAIS